MPRTRSESAHLKVLEAAIELVAAHGVDATSMDAIARRSGVSKATIYKHWKDKDALLLELLGHITGIHKRPTFDTGDIWADMVAVLRYQPPEHKEARERILPHLIAYSARHEVFGMTWRNMVMEPPRRELATLIAKGIAAKKLQARIDRDVVLALLIGPLLYAKMFAKRSPEEAKKIAEAAVHAFRSTYGIQ
jgi:AcrR family transcriptional regulator